MAEIFVDTKQLKSLAVEFAEFPKKVPKEVLVPALNHTIGKVNTGVKRGVSGRYVIKQSDVQGAMKINKANGSNPAASIVVRGKPKGLMHFRVKPKNVQTAKKKKPVSVMIKKESGYKQIGIKPAAFVAVANGAANVFHRKGKNRLPIERLVTLSIPQMAAAKAVLNPVQKMANEHLAERINHELNRKLKVKGSK